MYNIICQGEILCKIRRFRGKIDRGQEKRKKTTLKNGVKVLNVASLWVITLPRPQHLCSPGKKIILKVVWSKCTKCEPVFCITKFRLNPAQSGILFSF